MGAIYLPSFDVGHHPDEQPVRTPAFNVQAIFVGCLSSESSSPVPLVSIGAVHYNGSNIEVPYNLCEILSGLITAQ